MEEATVLEKSSLPTVDILVDALVPNENNTNEMSDSQLSRLIREIQEEGFMVPLNVIPLEGDQFLILGGEHRWKAAKVLGMSYVPCIVHRDEKWTDRDNVDMETFKLNAIKGSVSSEKFFQLYKRLAQNPKFGPEKVQDALAITDNDQWKRLTRNVEQSLKDQGAPQSVIDDVKKAEKSATSPEDLGKKLSKILQAHSESFMANAIVIQDEKGQNILVKASPEVFQAMKLLVEYAQKAGKNINEIMAPFLDDVLNNLNG